MENVCCLKNDTTVTAESFPKNILVQYKVNHVTI